MRGSLVEWVCKISTRFHDECGAFPRATLQTHGGELLGVYQLGPKHVPGEMCVAWALDASWTDSE